MTQPATKRLLTEANAAATYVAWAKTPSGDTTGATDKANLQAVIDAIPATGGRLLLPPGKFYLNGALTIAKPVKIEGSGGGFTHDAGTIPGRAITTIYVTTGNTDGLTITAPGCTLVDFAVVNTSSTDPTSGSGISISPAYNTHVSRVTVSGFYDNLTVQGWYCEVSDSFFYDPVRYGVRFWTNTPALYDHLDAGFVNNVISMASTMRTAQSALRWEGGGGLRVIGNKINGRGQPGSPGAGGSAGSFAYALDVEFTVPSIDLNVSGNSFANSRTSLLRITSNGGSIGTGVIVGNLFDSVVSGTCIEIGGPTTGTVDTIRAFSIANNTFSWLTSATAGIRAYNSRAVAIGPNVWGPGIPDIPLVVLAPSPDNGQALLGVSVAPQQVNMIDGLDMVQDNRTFGSSTNLFDGDVLYDYVKQVSISATATPVTLFSFDLDSTGAKGGAVFSELELIGQNSNSGHNSPNNKGVVIRHQRIVESPGGGGTVTLTTTGTDVAGGAGGGFLTVTYVTTTSNRVTITVQTNDATQVAFWGQARLRVRGKIAKFRKGL